MLNLFKGRSRINKIMSREWNRTKARGINLAFEPRTQMISRVERRVIVFNSLLNIIGLKDPIIINKEGGNAVSSYSTNSSSVEKISIPVTLNKPINP